MIAIIFAALAITAPVSEEERAKDAAEVTHAEALLAEADGRGDEAYEALKRASDAQPDNIEYSYDLARISFEQKRASLTSDARRFLSDTPMSAEHLLLRSYLLNATGRSDDAKNAAREARAQGNEEAAALVARIDRPAPASVNPLLSFSVAGDVRFEVDSNVTLIPDAQPFGQGGVRLGADFAAAWTPKIKDVQLSLGVDLHFANHLINRATLGLYDYFAARPFFGVQAVVGNNVLSARLSLNEVLLAGFAEHFMQDVGLSLEYRRLLNERHALAVYADVGYRDFVSTRFNLAGPTDRDGGRVTAGLGYFLRVDRFDGQFRAALQTEQTFGLEQSELGPLLDLVLRIRVWRVTLAATFDYQSRFYTRSTTARVDHRMSPGASVSFSILPWLGVDLAYSYVRNISNVYDYERHVGSLAVRGQY